jgi:ABC-type transport system involved in cytochrome bd biosynthesis fused ATPase/permease subunit
MNGNKIACLVLMMVLAGIAYGSQIMQKKASAMNEEAESANADYMAATDKCKRSEDELARYTASTADLRDFLASWEDPAERVGSGQEAETAIMSVVRTAGVLTLSQKFEVKDTHGSAMMPKALLGTLVVQDDYAKTINFLGELERTIPLARITSCHIKQGDTGERISLEVHIEIPLVNLKADVEVAKKK